MANCQIDASTSLPNNENIPMGGKMGCTLSDCIYAMPADMRENIISMVICKRRVLALWNTILFSRGVVKITSTLKLLTTTKHACFFYFLYHCCLLILYIALIHL